MQPTNSADSRSRWLAKLLDEHGGPLALYAAQWTNAADDCVQEAFVELASQQPPPDHPVAWLYRVVKHCGLNHARGEQRRTEREQTAWQHRLAGRPDDRSRRELLDAVAALPEDEREIVIMKTWGGLTFDEMSQALGISSSTLHRRYIKAIDQLRKQWEVPCPKTTNSE